MLEHVFLSVQDWQPILQKARDIRDDISTVMFGFERDEIQEVYDFMNWLCNKNFVFLGYVEYDFYDKDGKECLSMVDGSELGIYKTDNNDLKQRGLMGLPEQQRQFAKEPALIDITKSNIKSIVHRPIHMDYIAIKRLDFKGRVIGERRFLGMFTSIVYYQSADNIPFIRRKINRTLELANYDVNSHNGKSLRAILEFFPRDELFQISEKDLYTISLGVMSLESRPDVGLFVRKDKYERFASCMVYIPRDRFNTYIRKQIETTLEDAFKGTISGFYTQLTDSPLARLHLIIKTKPGKIPNVNIKKVTKKIEELTAHWPDGLQEELIESLGEKKSDKLFRAFHDSFPKGYMNYYPAWLAVTDVEKVVECAESNDPAISMQRSRHTKSEYFNLKIYTQQLRTPLSTMLPILENMGCQVIDVHPHLISPDWNKSGDVVMRDFRLSIPHYEKLDLENVKPLFEEGLSKVWLGEVENDGYNALILRAGLSYRQVEIIRAYGKYLKQTGLPYSEGYVASALCSHPVTTRRLVTLFEARFDTKTLAKAKRDTEISKIRDIINNDLADITNLAEDTILRTFADSILATWRTNFYQKTKDGAHKPYVSFKFDSASVPNLPLPRPHAEIYVYSTRIEGIHLRGGKVARGGLRWSDRPEDFRTEVLGLMKAQMVKNTVIVPVGSKGGFVVKKPPSEGGREAFMEEGVACYKMFLSGLLDVTDNIVEGKIVPPKQVVRHDGDDPYLVVAADKGTATFSDYANGVSEDYGFWLGDAFASGGSVGYDHKKMGITAKGAWVSVMRHFREMGIDTQSEAFSVVGIGDMMGDVFGNGMLLSKHIKLVAAFNHMHIFFDPSPDVAKTYKERERLFKLPRSSWADYNKKLISKGGGVFERSAKTVPLSKEMQKLLGVTDKTMAPDALISAILKSEVDLLWNGGIGTYVKARTEGHDEVGDRANNTVRVNGEDLRCKVMGEGGNLGFTQLGRIEFARHGGRINTDAIDNSAGVDCSDHEVNIKIALADAVNSRKLSKKNRDILLAKMTDNVSKLVLRDNQLQTQILTVTEMQAPELLESHAQMMQVLEQADLLNREVEYLPTDKEIISLRAEKKGLSRPELSVLLSYAKLTLYEPILESDVPDSPYFEDVLVRYFPTAMQGDYVKFIKEHRLRREIIATIITNNIVNRAGISFCNTLMQETGRPACDMARAYILTRDTFGLHDIWKQIENLDGKMDVEVQVEMFVEVNRFLERATLWFLRNCPQPLNISQVMDDIRPGVATYMGCFKKIASDSVVQAYQDKSAHFVELGAPKKLADAIASLESMASACDIISTANKTGLDIQIVGRAYYEIGTHLQLGWMRQSIHKLVTESHWDRLAARTLVGDVYDEQRRITSVVLSCLTKNGKWEHCFSDWQTRETSDIKKLHMLMQDLKTSEARSLSMFFLALNQIQSLSSEID